MSVCSKLTWGVIHIGVDPEHFVNVFRGFCSSTQRTPDQVGRMALMVLHPTLSTTKANVVQSRERRGQC